MHHQSQEVAALSISSTAVNSVNNEGIQILGELDEQGQFEIQLDSESKHEPTRSKKLKKGKTTNKSVGRRLEDVWNEFEVTVLGPYKKKTVCRHCYKKTSDGARAYRLREHLMKCEKFLQHNSGNPNLVTGNQLKVENRDHMKKTKKSNKACKTLKPSIIHLPSKPKSGKDIIIVSEKDVIDNLVVKFLISSKVTFNVVRNEEFKALVTTLRPDYVLPTPDQLQGPIFQRIFDEFQSESVDKLMGENAVLIQSGWNNICPIIQRLITHTLQLGNKKYFLNVVDISSENCSGFHCGSIIKEAISLAEKRYRCKIIGLVTDNINNFVEINDLFVESNSLFHVQASYRHLFLELGQSFINPFVMNKVVTIYKYFRSYDYQCYRIKENIMNVQEDFNWINQYDWMMVFIQDREKYIQILTDPKYTTFSEIQMTDPIVQIPKKGDSVDEDIFLDILNDPQTIQVVEDMNRLLSPIQYVLNFLKLDGCCLADGVSSWITWAKNQTFSTEHIQRINKYKNIALSPAGVTAYMLHPKYKGVLLSEDEMETGREYILSVNFEYLDPVVAFIQSDDTVYSKSLINENVCKSMDPIRWWKEQFRNTKLPSGFVYFTLNLMSFPANSTSWDSCFLS